MRVEDILREKGRDIIAVTEDVTVLAALELMKEKRIGAVLVKDEDGAICGVLSERDVARGLPEAGAKILDQAVGSLMTRDVITCKTGDTIAGIMALMTNSRIRHLPVLDEEELVGLISIGDVVKYRIKEAENEADALRNYITSG